MGHARALLSLKTDGQILDFSVKAIVNKLSVRQLESEIKKFIRKSSNKSINSVTDKKFTSSSSDLFIRDMVEKIRTSLGTKVALKGNENKGSLVIEYYSKETLEGIVQKILS